MIQLVRPHRGPVTQWYGNEQPDGLPHAGQDYGYTDGVNIFPEVYAAADGVVLFAGDSRNLGWPNQWYINPDFDRSDAQDSSAGNLVVIGHADGADTGYAHLESFSVKKGDTVRAGQQIAITGNTGYSFGKHLHFFLMFRPYNYGTPTYGCSNPNAYMGATAGGAISYQGTTVTPQEDDVKNEPIELQDAAQKVLRDNVMVKGGRSVAAALTQLIDSTDIIGARDLKALEELADLKALLGQLVKSTAANQSTYYLKGDKAPEVYALDVASGKLRHVGSAEFDVVTSIGIFKTVPQAKVDALVKGNGS